MNRLSFPLLLALGFSGSVARAEPGVDLPEPLPAAVPDARSAGASAATLTPERELPAEPQGELVRLARQPEAELLVNVLLTTNAERSYFEVVSETSGASLIVCGSPCEFKIWPGRYRLITNASSGYVGGVNQLTLESSSHVAVKLPSVERPVIGAVVGALGIASALAGVVLLASYRCDDMCGRTTSGRNRLGFAALGGGVVVAPIGWLLFSQGRNPELDVTPTQAQHEQ